MNFNNHNTPNPISKKITEGYEDDIKKISYDEFFQFVWDDSNLSNIVSVSYQSKYEDYIRSLTFDIYHFYVNGAEVTEQMCVKIIEIHFSNLFRFRPKNENIKEIKDKYVDY